MVRRMWRAAILATLAAIAACAPAEQESVRTVAAVEVLLRTTADRNDLVALLGRHAAADGELHVDDVSEGWRDFQQRGNAPAATRMSINVGVWRGANDDDLEASVDDMGHIGRAWISFLKGRQPERAARFRKAVLADIERRWPDAQTLPVLPTGGLPLVDDLRMTPAGYRIDPAAAARYGLPDASALVASN